MRQDHTGSGWEIGQEVNYQRPVPRPATPHTVVCRQESGDSPIPILAKLPDLDAPPPPRQTLSRQRKRSPRASGDGRLISQALSMKLLAGGAVLLVALAVVPWMFGDKEGPAKDQGTETELPTWQQDAAPKFTGSPPRFDEPDEPLQPSAPAELAESAPAEPASAVPPREARHGIGAPPPAASDPRPAVPTENATAAREAAKFPAGPPASPNSVPGPGPWPNEPQTPVVHAPSHEPLAGAHPGAPMPNSAQAMRPMQIQPPTGTAPPAATNTGPHGAYPATEFRSPQYGPAPGYRSAPGEEASPNRPGPWDTRLAPESPDTPSPQPQATQPGVANFQGIIESPPVRTTHEYTRPGIY